MYHQRKNEQLLEGKKYKNIKDKINLHKLPRKSAVKLFRLETGHNFFMNTYVEQAFYPLHNAQYVMKTMF